MIVTGLFLHPAPPQVRTWEVMFQNEHHVMRNLWSVPDILYLDKIEAKE